MDGGARVLMHPLSLAERAPTGLPPMLFEVRWPDLAETAAVFVGYLEAVTRPNPERTLRGLLEAFVIRDAPDLLRIQHLDAFRRLLVLLAGQVPGQVNASELASLCGVSRAGTLRYWRSTSKADVDFVCEDAEGGLLGVECKASTLTRPELTRSARSFIEAYRPARFVLVNLGQRHDEVVAGVHVAWRTPAWLARPLDTLGPPE